MRVEMAITQKKVGRFCYFSTIKPNVCECISVFFSLIQKTFQTTNFLELGPGNGLC